MVKLRISHNIEAISALFQVTIARLKNNHELLSSMPVETITALLNLALEHIPYDDLSFSEVSCHLASILAQSFHETVPLLMAKYRDFGDSSTVQLRFASIIAKLLGSGDEFFRLCLDEGAVNVIVQLCRNDDALVQVTTCSYGDVCNTRNFSFK